MKKHKKEKNWKKNKKFVTRQHTHEVPSLDMVCSTCSYDFIHN